MTDTLDRPETILRQTPVPILPGFNRFHWPAGGETCVTRWEMAESGWHHTTMPFAPLQLMTRPPGERIGDPR
jgi:hypothetical protein